jgi:hemolysin activation/secretion protein
MADSPEGTPPPIWLDNGVRPNTGKRVTSMRLWFAVAACSIVQTALGQETNPLPTGRMTPAGVKAEASLFPAGLPGEDIQMEPETPSPAPKTASEKVQPIPVRPILPPLTNGPGGLNQTSSARTVYVKGFQFKGNHAFSDRVLQNVVQDYSHRQLNAEGLEEARQKLTAFYISHGYITSGAILEEQNPMGGIFTFQVVEGKLTDVKLSGNYWFRGYWLRHEMRQAAGSPLNFDRLKEGLELLRQNPLISEVNAELKPGGVPGESILDAQVKDTQPFRLGLDFNNERPPSVGSEILNTHLADLNLTGNNDPLRLDYGIVQSTHGQSFKASGWDNVDGSYSIGFTPWDTALQIHGSKSNTAIVEAAFSGLDISSRLEEYGAVFRQPLYETLRDDLAVSVGFDSERDKTFLKGVPFSLSPGAVRGVSDVSVLRFAQEYVNRSQVHVLALRSTFNLGLAALDSTVNDSGADSRFFSWLAQSQYIRRLRDTDNLLVLRVNGQLSGNPLLAPEEFSIGGAESVRGYRENELLRDNGVFGSVELRFPIIHGKGQSVILVLAPFFDIGAGWESPADSRAGGATGRIVPRGSQGEALASAGLGIILTPTRRVHAELYWGYGFNRRYIESDQTDPQDYGLTFALSVDVF